MNFPMMFGIVGLYIECVSTMFAREANTSENNLYNCYESCTSFIQTTQGKIYTAIYIVYKVEKASNN